LQQVATVSVRQSDSEMVLHSEMRQPETEVVSARQTIVLKQDAYNC
jgi:hypothetical protein